MRKAMTMTIINVRHDLAVISFDISFVFCKLCFRYLIYIKLITILHYYIIL